MKVLLEFMLLQAVPVDLVAALKEGGLYMLTVSNVLLWDRLRRIERRIFKEDKE